MFVCYGGGGGELYVRMWQLDNVSSNFYTELLMSSMHTLESFLKWQFYMRTNH